ncbi:hypothetical protein ACFZBU_15675 [Embleya sp. NPDC008237]
MATLGTAGCREAYERGAALPREQAPSAVLARLEPVTVPNAPQ